MLDRVADKYLFFVLTYVIWDNLRHPTIKEFLIIQLFVFLIWIEGSLLVLGILGWILKLRITSNWTGKWKFGFACATICFISIFLFTPYLKPYLFQTVPLVITQILLLVTSILAAFSFISYVFTYASDAYQWMKEKTI